MLEQKHNLTLVIFQVKILCCLKQLIYIKLISNIYVIFEYLIGCIVSDIFNIHATCSAVNKYGFSCLSIESNTQIKLLID